MKQKVFGLVGRNISYSFSKTYFTGKFQKQELKNFRYENFDIQSIEELPVIIGSTKGLRGLNVTIPYKEKVITLLPKLSKTARIIGAVNTIAITKKGLKGYNTDHYGFKKALKPLLKEHHQRALILGTGGASKAVAYALRSLQIDYDFVSRNATDTIYSYDQLDENIFSEYQIVINTTPLGTYPDTDECPPISYRYFTEQHIAFDLVYNPENTKFMQLAKAHGAVVKNGYEMLVHQAEKAWKIWNK